MKSKTVPTGREVMLEARDFIVSKTDTQGRIVYANRIFMRISGYSEGELLGKQHNIVRHPDMPRGVFKLLWGTIAGGSECFAYVKNLCKNGDHYWVFANVTPDYGPRGEIIGYFSVRRRPTRDAVNYFSQLYAEMLRVEQQAGAKQAIEASSALLARTITEKGYENYETFVLGH